MQAASRTEEPASVAFTHGRMENKFCKLRRCCVFMGVLSLAACITDPPPGGQVAWETSLTGGIEHPGATGSAAAVSGGTTTHASIAMTGLTGGSYTWGVFRGACADPGGILGTTEVYPALNASMTGEATVEAIIGQPMTRGGRFFAEVRTSDGASVACGDFVQWQ